MMFPHDPQVSSWLNLSGACYAMMYYFLDTGQVALWAHIVAVAGIPKTQNAL